VGIDWSEAHRAPAIVNGWAPWTVRFPMCDPPYLSKQDMLDAARAAGLEPPRLYELGFSHIFAAWWSCLDSWRRWRRSPCLRVAVDGVARIRSAACS
jgi:hypothetical protein